MAPRVTVAAKATRSIVTAKRPRGAIAGREFHSTVTSKGQLVIPAELRRRHYIKKGTRIHLEDVGGGILLRPITGAYIDSLCGIVAGRGLPINIEREPDQEIG